MIDTTNIPKPNGHSKTIKRKGTTQDIINSIQGFESYYDSQFCKFAQQFKGGKPGLKKLWRFVKYKVRYEKDDFTVSKQMTPPALWKGRRGD